MPFPLYGSGFLNDLILAETSPTNCLSIPDTFISVRFAVIEIFSGDQNEFHEKTLK